MSENPIRGEVFEPANLVGYQEAAVVSRILVKKEKGSVTLFAFDEGQELSEHTAPFDALVHVVEGRAEIVLDGEPHAVGTGEAIVMPADVPHAVRAPERFKMVLTMIRA